LRKEIPFHPKMFSGIWFVTRSWFDYRVCGQLENPPWALTDSRARVRATLECNRRWVCACVSGWLSSGCLLLLLLLLTTSWRSTDKQSPTYASPPTPTTTLAEFWSIEEVKFVWAPLWAAYFVCCVRGLVMSPGC